MRLNKPYTNTQYADLAVYCNSNNSHIEDKGEYLEAVINPPPPAPTIQEQIIMLENSITKRNYRMAMLGDEYAISKINEVENKINALREQL